ncbi:sensor domain-containing diguanylate cyclase [Methylophaga sulfidovorans]|uniref:PAS domain S-box-containing protein/diguanylate cyclase (GGDEF) domain-containing protein n=1 Tax=Methylophaga sulfidovorans TaxID=45496 RepID=A0A1I4BQ12_9GAMM|nr:sensor domain-containing diguanylate cyclase [Methylophaga sulfidovorans]SFK70277.1 PAS domain S-box-containing protein/diguanylate cyclase (GGDEF) domain-containing protein [Methylophaga sulfidovorans]
MLTKLRTSIATRLAFILVLAGVVSALSTGYLFYSYTYTKELAQSQKNIRQLAHAVSQTAAIAAYLDDLTLAKEVVEGVAGSDLVKAVELKSTQESLALRGTMPTMAETMNFDLESPFSSGEVVGKLRLAPNIALIKADARKAAINHVVLISIQTAVLTALIIFLLNTQLITEIKRLARRLHNIRVGSDQRLVPTQSHKYDEIGSLTHDINELLSSVEENINSERTLRLEVEELENRFRDIFEQSSHGIAIVDTDGKMKLHNPSFKNIIGEKCFQKVSRQDSISFFVLFDEERARLESAAAEVLIKGESQAVDIKVDDEPGTRWLYCLISLMTDDEKESSFEIVLQDISERRNREEKLKGQAEIDALTNLYNRGTGESRIEQLISSADTKRNLYGLFMIDLDGFKPVNDQYGHEAGDKVLIAVANRLLSSIRAGDIAIRWGGDEFVIFARLTSDLYEASNIAEKLLAVLREPIECQPEMLVTISASIGISLYPFNTDNVETLLKYADLAMYEVKSQYKNGYNYFKPPVFKVVDTQNVITGF